MATLFMHKKGERRNDKSRRAHQRKRDKAWAKSVLQMPESIVVDGQVLKNPTREQFLDLAREILARRGR